MKDKLKLDISIFYTENMWYKILNDAITPFLSNTKDIESYVLLLNESRGSHVHLGLTVQEEKALFLAQKFDIYIKKYLKNHPSISTRSLLPKNGLYMDFNNNSVHYGIFNYSVVRSPSKTYEIYFQNVASVLLKVFQTYKENTLPDLVEIMIQLFTVFCNAIQLDNQKAARLFDYLLEIEYKNYKESALQKAIKINEENFENNKEPIVDYLKEYRKSNVQQYDEEWLYSWEMAVKTSHSDLIKIIESDKMTDAYAFMIDSLCNTFSFKNKISAYSLFSNALKYLA